MDQKNQDMFARAKEAMPLGVNSNYRYWGDDDTIIVKNAKGAYMWDQDDKKYIDYRLGFGCVILGHAHPKVLEKVQEAMAIGNIYALTHEYEIYAAEKIKALTGVDLVRFANSGTEATMHAVRIARAYTGRDKILKFEGHYHGFHDNLLWNTFPPIAALGYRRSAANVPQGSGIPAAFGRLVLTAPFNDVEILEKKVKDNCNDLACIILEPIMGNCSAIMPKDGYLQAVRDLCDKYGIVMIMDEVKTGFRIAKGGAQEYFGIKSDLVTYAKAVGNGFPVAAIGGKKEIMGEIGYLKIAHGGTYCGNVVGTAAACAALDEIAGGALDRVHAHGDLLQKGLKKILAAKGIPAVVQGPPGLTAVVFTEEDEVTEYRAWAEADHPTQIKVHQKLHQKGVLPDVDPREPWFCSAAHTDEDAEFALSAYAEALDEI